MKKRFDDWYKIAGNAVGSVRNAVADPVRVLDLPGFRELEDKLLIYRPRRGEVAPELSVAIDELSKKTFGIVERDTLFEIPNGYADLPDFSEEKWEINSNYNRHEDRFETSDATDDEAVEYLLKVGIDFRDKRGNPLLCTKLYCRQAEAAYKGIMGAVPDRVATNLEAWTKRMEIEAALHISRKSLVHAKRG